MKSLPWFLGLTLVGCAGRFTTETEASGGSMNTSGGAIATGARSGSGGSEDVSGGTSSGGALNSSGGIPSATGGTGGSATGGKATGGASSGGRSAGGATASGGAKSSGGSTAGGSTASGGAKSSGGSSAGGSGGTASGGAGKGGSTSGGSAGMDGGAGGVGPEIPTDDLILWLRADRGVTVENNAVTRWNDHSGAANDAVPPTTTSRPTRALDGISGLPSIVFDGADDFLAMPAGFADFSAGISIFSVAEAAASDVCWSLLEFSNGSEVNDISYGQFNRAPLYEVSVTFFNGGALAVGAPQMVSAVHRSVSTMDVRVNGITAGTMDIPLPVTIQRSQNFVGRTLYANCTVYPGEIGELIVYRRAVSVTERTAIEAYLRERWTCCGN